MSKDKDYIRMIHSARWLRLRNERIREHPFCEWCRRDGRINYATEVHHLTPVESARNPSEKERLMFSPFNIVALCHECHTQAHKEMRSKSREETQRRNQKELERFKKMFLG